MASTPPCKQQTHTHTHVHIFIFSGIIQFKRVLRCSRVAYHWGGGGFGDYIHGIKVRCRVGGLGLGVGGVYASIWVGTID